MKSLFSPHTFSTDWELMVFDHLGRKVDDAQIHAFAMQLTEELDLPIHTDWQTIEFGLGINTSLGQIRDRMHRLTRRTTQLLAEHDIDLYPCGSHPVERLHNASHIHVGTLHDERAANRVEMAMFAYVPAFAALAANSPFFSGRRGKYKSYRVRNVAFGANRPGMPRDPELTQSSWGSDAAPKIYARPTLEVRIIDAASSPAFLAELTVFVAAIVHHVAEQSDGKMLTPAEYRQYLTNRWLAARDGLQATFDWNGRTIPATEMLNQMLDSAGPSLARLGAKRGDLKLVNQMLQKRVCQADFALSLMDRYSDPYALAVAHGNLVRHWEAFDEYLATAPRLKPRPHPTAEEIIQEHLGLIGQGTHHHRLRAEMWYPAAFLDEMVDQLEVGGWIEREITTNRGMLLHRRK